MSCNKALDSRLRGNDVAHSNHVVDMDEVYFRFNCVTSRTAPLAAEVVMAA